FDIMYGEGVSKMGEIIDLGVKAGVVEKSGSWFSYDSQRIGQGRENAKTFLKANPDIATKIEAAIRANAGLIAEKILAGPEEDDKDDDAAGGYSHGCRPGRPPRAPAPTPRLAQAAQGGPASRSPAPFTPDEVREARPPC